MATVKDIEQALESKGWSRDGQGLLVLRGEGHVLSLEAYSFSGKIYGGRYLERPDGWADWLDDLECLESADSSEVAEEWHDECACLIP